MRPAIVRRTSTKVVNGVVSAKSRYTLTSPRGYTIDKEPAGSGFRHVVSPRQLEQFIELIPDWEKLSYRLQRIVLLPGSIDRYGYHSYYRRLGTAVIALHAWPKKLWTPMSLRFFKENRPVFEALGVFYQINLSGVVCQFTVAQARAFSLIDVFMHEVGHHQDWLHRRGPRLRGKEAYAEDFARSYLDYLLPLYGQKFGDPAFSRDSDEKT